MRMTVIRKSYPREFESEALHLADASGKPKAQVERDPGLSQGLLFHWRRKLACQGIEAFPSHGRLTGTMYSASIWSCGRKGRPCRRPESRVPDHQRTQGPASPGRSNSRVNRMRVTTARPRHEAGQFCLADMIRVILAPLISCYDTGNSIRSGTVSMSETIVDVRPIAYTHWRVLV
jgi:transposase-like protein